MPRTQVTETLFFDDLSGCIHARPGGGIAIVHACKEPCHRRAAGYDAKSLPATHPHYLAWADAHNLYLNLIDPPVPLFQKESFAHFFAFMDARPLGQPVLIHCNKGESRAPSLALLYMARRGLLPGDSYAAARTAFESTFPYKPGKGIALFLEANWTALGAL